MVLVYFSNSDLKNVSSLRYDLNIEDFRSWENLLQRNKFPQPPVKSLGFNNQEMAVSSALEKKIRKKDK